MKNTISRGALAAPLLMFAMTLPGHADSTASTTCADGTSSTATGRGACSGHGGVQKAAKPATAGNAPATTALASTPVAPAGADRSTSSAAKPASAASAGAAPPAGATAKCTDGTYSTSKSHSGACSKHGGVSDWLPAQ